MEEGILNISIDYDLCTGCNRCVQVCGINFFEVPGKAPRTADPVTCCIRCGHCAAICPQDAVSHTGLQDIELAPLAQRPSFEQLMTLLQSRRSRREFTEREVSRQDIEALLKAAGQAANGLNRRNVHYTVITDPDVLKDLSRRIGRQTAWLSRRLENPLWRVFFRLVWGGQYRELEPLVALLKPMAEAARQGRDMVLYNAPCAILIHTRRDDACGNEDAVYCGADILLAAEALGLGACVIGFLTEPINRDNDLARLVGIPRGHKVHTSMVVGHPRFPYSRGISRPAPEARFL